MKESKNEELKKKVNEEIKSPVSSLEDNVVFVYS